MRLNGITVWDGTEQLGVADLSWESDILDTVAAAPVDRHPDLAVIPGLIDTHVHLTGPAQPGDYTYGTWPLVTTTAERTLHAAANAQALLRYGVTTVRDMASDERPVALRRVYDAGLLPGPRVLAYGVVNMTAGHQDLFTPPDVADRPPTADGPDACRALVRRYARAGMDGIKVMTGGGVLSSGDRAEWRNYTAAELDAIVDEAHALSLPVAAHAHTEPAVQAALDAGVDSIEHGTLLSAAQAETIAARGITVAPTLVINDGIADGTVPASAESRAKAKALVADRDGKMRAAHAAGVRYVLGTDSNGSLLPWGSVYPELAAFTRILGATAEQALTAATSHAAAAVGLGHRIGRLAEGYAADLVVVRGRPWQRITDLTADAVVAVVCRGRLRYGALPS
ncbi:metal-dependent hydrolase family protein [Actinocatenispora rupis]|uniref:Hydrolase n=1 Tax=Actinocatenispora rupis TaxID=519421 RepID=A0A8J3NB16_9ACTN|nr:amidohydrolase family protein [Actinocatenispora rupis]GID12904.1 hydrolase [Actinocatenispora rupis]